MKAAVLVQHHQVIIMIREERNVGAEVSVDSTPDKLSRWPDGMFHKTVRFTYGKGAKRLGSGGPFRQCGGGAFCVILKAGQSDFCVTDGNR